MLMMLLGAATVQLDSRTEQCISAVHGDVVSALTACDKLPAPMLQLWGTSEEPPPPELCPDARAIGKMIGGLSARSGPAWTARMVTQFDERIEMCRNPPPVEHAPELKIPQLWD